MRIPVFIKHFFFTIVALLPLAWLATVYSTLPIIVPTHFNASFQPNGYSSRSTLWFIGGLLATVAIGVYFLLHYIRQVDPKRRDAAPTNTFSKLAVGILLLTTAMNFIGLRASAGYMVGIRHLLLPLVGVLFMFMGNIMYSIKPNYFAGIRLPWTLNDDDNWRATHRVAGIIWFVGGLLLLMLFFIVSGAVYALLLQVLIAVMILVPIIYSFLYFRKHHKTF